MPYWMKPETLGIHRIAFRDWLREDGEAYTPHEFDEVRHQMYKELIDSAESPEHEQSLWRKAGRYFFNGPGIVNPDSVPRNLRVKTTPKALPQLFFTGWAPVVCESVKRKIEEIEPNIHAFYQLNIQLKDEQAPREQYYLLHIRAEGPFFHKSPNNVLVAKKDECQNRAIWVEDFLNSVTGVSDEVFEVLDKKKTEKLFDIKKIDYE